MKITREGKNLVKIYGNETDVFLGNRAAQFEKEGTSNLVGFSTQIAGAMQKPGEFEYGDFEVIGVEAKKIRNGVADIFKVIYDGVNIVFQYGDVENIDKGVLDQIGTVDIVLLDGEVELLGAEKLVQKLNPEVIVYLNFKTEKIEEILGTDVNDTQNIVSFKESDFRGDEAATMLIALK